MQLIYKPYEDDEVAHDAYRERESFAVARQEAAITDVKSAAGADRKHAAFRTMYCYTHFPQMPESHSRSMLKLQYTEPQRGNACCLQASAAQCISDLNVQGSNVAFRCPSFVCCVISFKSAGR